MDDKKGTIFVIEDSFSDYEKIRNTINDNMFDILPEIEDQKELNKVLFGKEFLNELNKKEKKRNLEKSITNYIIKNYKEISCILLDLFLIQEDDVYNNDISSTLGFRILQTIRNIKIKNSNWNKFIPIIIVTKAEHSSENIKDSLIGEIRANDYLTKDSFFNEDEKIINVKLQNYCYYFDFIINTIPKPKPSYDIAVISALREEMEPFRKNFHSEYEKIEPDLFYFKSYKLKNNKSQGITIITAVQENMGLFDASFLISQIFLRFDVKHIFMIGVCGGNRNNVNIGDIMIPNEIILFSKGKLEEKSFQADFETANNHSMFYNIISDDSNEILKEIKDELSKNVNQKFKKDSNDFLSGQEIQLYSDAMACSDYVIDRKGLLEDLKKLSGKRKLISADTESFSVIKYGEIIEGLKTDVIKSVMDLTEGKGDKYKEVASYISANFLFKILEKGIYPI